MSLRSAVLASLLRGEASGYDLAKSFDASVSNFWMATPQQVYKELEHMEAGGLIQARVVAQERRPNKRLFSLTEAGRDALRDFLAEPVKPLAIRDDLLVKVQALGAGDVDAVRDAIAERLKWSTDKLAHYAERRRLLLGGLSDEEFLACGENIGPYLTLLRGSSFEADSIRWAEQALSILNAVGPAGR